MSYQDRARERLADDKRRRDYKAQMIKLRQLKKQEDAILRYEAKLLKKHPTGDFIIVSVSTVKMRVLASRGWEIIASPVSFFSGTYQMRIHRLTLEDRVNG